MEERNIIFLIIFIVTSIFAISIFSFVYSDVLKLDLSPDKSNYLEKCNQLYYSGSGSTNVVFFSDMKRTEEYFDYFFTIPPFNEYKDNFNFYYIDGYKPDCELYKNIATFCYSRELMKKAASCPNDYIVVVNDLNSKIRSSSYLSVISMNEKNPVGVFPHEFAHVFGNLDDEYVPAELKSTSINCKKNCGDFSKIVKDSECYNGCSKSNYYRSSENSLMRSLYSKAFGDFNEAILEDYLKKTERSTLSGNVVSDGAVDCLNQRYFLIIGDYVNGKFEIVSKTLEIGCANGADIGEFRYDAMDDGGNILESHNFNMRYVYNDGQEEGDEMISGEVFSNDEEFPISIPYNGDISNVKVFDNNKLLTSFTLGEIRERSCFDNDIENDLSIRGNVIYKNIDYEDVCAENGLSVMQYLCVSDKLRNFVKRCSSGTMCNEGKCGQVE